MKKIVLILSLVLVQQHVFSQVFKGIGAYGALTESRHKYKNKDAGSRQFTAIDYANNPDFYNGRDYVGKEHFSWGAGIFAEFSSNYAARWQTEISYTKKGSKEKNLTDPFTGARSGFQTNKYTYIQWNNYLKYYSDMGIASAKYWMIGIRAEYLLNGSSSANAPFSEPKRIWASGDIGVGMEFPFIRKINWFIEEHWNPDIWNPKVRSTTMRNRTFETRVGLVYRPRRKSIDDCNAPKYRGPAY